MMGGSERCSVWAEGKRLGVNIYISVNVCLFRPRKNLGDCWVYGSKDPIRACGFSLGIITTIVFKVPKINR